jgi:complex iron-sulfur molybdoenzyme family reductase subunit gamma
MANPETVSAVSFQALHNGDALALRVQWDDPSEDRQDPGDALALAFLPHGASGDVVTLPNWPLSSVPALDWFAWSARSGLREMVADNYDAVFAATASMDAGHVSYEDGRWTLVLQRPLVPHSSERAAALAPGAFAPVAFAVWDGSKGDRDGQKAVTTWYTLQIEK